MEQVRFLPQAKKRLWNAVARREIFIFLFVPGKKNPRQKRGFFIET